MDIFLDYFGVAVFAISGALTAGKKNSSNSASDLMCGISIHQERDNKTQDEHNSHRDKDFIYLEKQDEIKGRQSSAKLSD